MNPLLIQIGVGVVASVIALICFFSNERQIEDTQWNRRQHAQRPIRHTWSGDSDIGGNCCICLDEMSDEKKVFTLPCKHKMHLDCLKKMFDVAGEARADCPICRGSIGRNAIDDIRSVWERERHFQSC